MPDASQALQTKRKKNCPQVTQVLKVISSPNPNPFTTQSHKHPGVLSHRPIALIHKETSSDVANSWCLGHPWKTLPNAPPRSMEKEAGEAPSKLQLALVVPPWVGTTPQWLWEPGRRLIIHILKTCFLDGAGMPVSVGALLFLP